MSSTRPSKLIWTRYQEPCRAKPPHSLFSFRRTARPLLRCINTSRRVDNIFISIRTGRTEAKLLAIDHRDAHPPAPVPWLCTNLFVSPCVIEFTDSTERCFLGGGGEKRDRRSGAALLWRCHPDSKCDNITTGKPT